MLSNVQLTSKILYTHSKIYFKPLIQTIAKTQSLTQEKSKITESLTKKIAELKSKVPISIILHIAKQKRQIKLNSKET